VQDLLEGREVQGVDVSSSMPATQSGSMTKFPPGEQTAVPEDSIRGVGEAVVEEGYFYWHQSYGLGLRELPILVEVMAELEERMEVLTEMAGEVVAVEQEGL